MILLRVLEPGFLTTVQDLGRPGYLGWGIPPSGAMDEVALRLANLFVGNPPGEAALEITRGGLQLECLSGGLLALAGAEMGAAIHGDQVPNWRSFRLERGHRLHLGFAREGCRAYLSMAGGIDVPPFLGSRSTFLRAGVGGLEGRALRRGDLIASIGQADLPAWPFRLLEHEAVPVYGGPCLLRVLPGPQDGSFTRRGWETFFGSSYCVSEKADRMGLRLEGPPVEAADGYDILSDAVPPGAVQVAGDGRPILLLADRQTTGGYPKIATVVRADQWKAGQLVPGQEVHFQEVTLVEALACYAQYRQMLDAQPRLLRSLPGDGLQVQVNGWKAEAWLERT